MGGACEYWSANATHPQRAWQAFALQFTSEENPFRFAGYMRLLIIEDQKRTLKFLNRGLKEAGYSVDSAESAGAGMTMAWENPYDLVVLDVMLPDKNGMDVVRELRANGFSQPVLMLSALSQIENRVRGLEAGADDYLTKPFSFEELLARIRALLRRSSGELPSDLVFEDIKMDLVKRKVLRAGQEVSLTQKEFSLLEYFMRNPGRPITRTEICEHVWDINFDPESNVIDVYVAMLRKKIDAPFDTKLIHTVVGVGYVLKGEE